MEPVTNEMIISKLTADLCTERERYDQLLTSWSDARSVITYLRNRVDDEMNRAGELRNGRHNAIRLFYEACAVIELCEHEIRNKCGHTNFAALCNARDKFADWLRSERCGYDMGSGYKCVLWRDHDGGHSGQKPVDDAMVCAKHEPTRDEDK